MTDEYRMGPCPGEPIVTLESGDQIVGVDASIAPIVDALNRAGIETIASCSGHGFRPGDIALRDGRELIIARDFDEARRINALFPLDINGGRQDIGDDLRHDIAYELAEFKWTDNLDDALMLADRILALPGAQPLPIPYRPPHRPALISQAQPQKRAVRHAEADCGMSG